MLPLAKVTAPLYPPPFLNTYFANSRLYEITTLLLRVATYSEASLLNIELKNLLHYS
jgi:hypothetical protein